MKKIKTKTINIHIVNKNESIQLEKHTFYNIVNIYLLFNIIYENLYRKKFE